MRHKGYLALNVPYEDKDKAKALYARWDAKNKTWYANNPKYYYKFSKWIYGSVVVTDFIGVATAQYNCWKCSKSTLLATPVLTDENAVCVEERGSLSDIYGYDFLPLSWTVAHQSFPKSFIDHARQTYSIQEVFSKTAEEKYLGVVCEHCHALQGDFFLYEDPDSPFSMFYSDVPLTIDMWHLDKGDFALPYTTVNMVISPTAHNLARAKFHNTEIVIRDN